MARSASRLVAVLEREQIKSASVCDMRFGLVQMHSEFQAHQQAPGTQAGLSSSFSMSHQSGCHGLQKTTFRATLVASILDW